MGKYIQRTIYVFLIILNVETALSHEILLKNGSSIKTTNYWIENDILKYEKVGGILSLKMERVSEIIDENSNIYNDATIYLTDGKSGFYRKIVKKDEKYYCQSQNTQSIIYNQNEVIIVLLGRDHKFNELPADAQKNWTKATIIFKDDRYLLVRQVYKEADKIHCKTYFDEFSFDYNKVKDVLKGHTRSARFHELSQEEQKKWESATIIFHDNSSLLVKEIWRDGDVIYCKTPTESYRINLEKIKGVIKGHNRTPNYSELTKEQQDGVRERAIDENRRKEMLKNEIKKEFSGVSN
jgi:hypothetical protein